MYVKHLSVYKMSTISLCSAIRLIFSSGFSFGLRSVYLRSYSLYARPTLGLRYDFNSVFRSVYVMSTFGLYYVQSSSGRCPLCVWSTFGRRPFYALFYVRFYFQLYVGFFVRSSFEARPVYVRSTLGLLSVYLEES